MAKAENTKPFMNKIQSGRKDVIGEGFFKDTGHGIKEMGRGQHDVRSASFHPIDPVLACGLFHGGLVFLRGSSHATSFENWEIEPKKCPCDKAILSIQWNVDGTKVAAGSDDGAVIVWCYPGQGKQIFRRQGRSNFPLIAWNPFNRDVLASYNNGADSKHVLIGNLASEKPLNHTIISNLNFCNTVDWISNNQLACGNDDGTIEIHEMEYPPKKQLKFRTVLKIRHNLNDEERLRILSTIYFPTGKTSSARNGRQMSDVLSISWNNEFNLLASGGRDKQVKIWSLNNNDTKYVLKIDSDCQRLVWNSSGYGNDLMKETTQKILIACGLDQGSIVIWYPFEHGNQTCNLEGHLSQIHQLLFSPDGRYLASTDMSKKLIIWSAKSWKSIYILPSSEFIRFPYTMTWDAASSKLGISERTGQKTFKMIEYILAESCCAGCNKTFEKLKRCARCHSIFYCSKECQCSHWPQHKLVCNKNE